MTATARGARGDQGQRRRRGALRTLAAAAAVGVLTLTATGPAAASPPASGRVAGQRSHPQLTVLTRNLYLGASLTPALTATDPASFLGAVARIHGTARATDFPARAQLIADEIAAQRPDLIGLQEVTRWVTSGPGVPPTQDFLEILGAALAARGLDYDVAAVAQNADIGPLPLVAPCASTVIGACLVSLQDRDVILVRGDRKGLTWSNPRSGAYRAQQQFTPPVPGAAPVSFRRGWATIDVQVGGERVHFANTHLETEDFPAVQQAQAAEFLAGPAFGRGIDIAVGDFNSAADGSTTTSYRALTQRLRDAWLVNRRAPGLTCCQNETLSNPVPQLTSRIDLVLTGRGAQVLSARVVGAAPVRAIAPRYASDHAGVVATLRVDD